MNRIIIERATVQQSADALLLIEEYYAAVNVIARDSPAAILRYLSDQRSAIWVAYQSSTPAGCILVRPLAHPHLPVDITAAELKRLYVRPAYRGHGIASLLLQVAEQFAAGQNVDWLYLDTKEDLSAAIVFYQRNGYSRCDRYNNNPQATIFMRKHLCDSAVNCSETDS